MTCCIRSLIAVNSSVRAPAVSSRLPDGKLAATDGIAKIDYHAEQQPEQESYPGDPIKSVEASAKYMKSIL